MFIVDTDTRTAPASKQPARFFTTYWNHLRWWPLSWTTPASATQRPSGEWPHSGVGCSRHFETSANR